MLALVLIAEMCFFSLWDYILIVVRCVCAKTDAFQFCAKYEGILPALEPSHALGHVIKIAPKLNKDHIIIMNLCGRGDKDVFTVAEALGVKL